MNKELTLPYTIDFDVIEEARRSPFDTLAVLCLALAPFGMALVGGDRSTILIAAAATLFTLPFIYALTKTMAIRNPFGLPYRKATIYEDRVEYTENRSTQPSDPETLIVPISHFSHIQVQYLHDFGIFVKYPWDRRASLHIRSIWLYNKDRFILNVPVPDNISARALGKKLGLKVISIPF